MSEMESFSSLRRVWMPFGHVKIEYLKCYDHAFNIPGYETCYTPTRHDKIYVNYRNAYYCFKNYKLEYFDRRTKKICEMTIGRQNITSTFLNLNTHLKRAKANAVERKCNHQHCICFISNRTRTIGNSPDSNLREHLFNL